MEIPESLINEARAQLWQRRDEYDTASLPAYSQLAMREEGLQKTVLAYVISIDPRIDRRGRMLEAHHTIGVKPDLSDFEQAEILSMYQDFIGLLQSEAAFMEEKKLLIKRQEAIGRAATHQLRVVGAVYFCNSVELELAYPLFYYPSCFVESNIYSPLSGPTSDNTGFLEGGRVQEDVMREAQLYAASLLPNQIRLQKTEDTAEPTDS